ncbi:MAG: protein-glutamate O-methyltransferase CheR [Deltaproteobacteria bacterium]|nr:protein-glutamate O-methyltransferase CheR [Deltaproteobacteria bacterium]
MTLSGGRHNPILSTRDFRLLRSVLLEYCGIEPPDSYRERMARLLTPRLKALGLEGFSAYYLYLRHAPQAENERLAFAEAMVNHETYFFREQYQLDALAQDVLPDLAKRNRRSRRLSVWSAGCSTGEEAYSLAVIIKESGLFDDWDLQILGTDISSKALAKARRALYGSLSFRQAGPMPERVRRTYFKPVGGQLQVVDSIRTMVRFFRLNLLDRSAISVLPTMDVILCRNVLIYFPEETKKQVVQTFYEKLRPAGYLLLGHSENLLSTTSNFECVHVTGDLVYRRPDIHLQPPVQASDQTRRNRNRKQSDAHRSSTNSDYSDAKRKPNQNEAGPRNH